MVEIVRGHDEAFCRPVAVEAAVHVAVLERAVREARDEIEVAVDE